MAIKFAAKDPAKPEPSKAVKDVAPKKAPVQTQDDEAVDLFDPDAKPTPRKGKSK